MIFEKQHHNPFKIEISFNRLIENLEEIAMSDVDYRSQYATGLLKDVARVPELRTGITDGTIITKHNQLIRNLLADLFPTALTNNEIKAITIPFQNITFNYSARFQTILNNAGPEFDMEIRDFDDSQFYIMSCCLILNAYYGYKFNFSRPFFYDIPDAEGVIRHYRILYNADFIEILPTETSIDITSEDVELLIDNFSNLDLWKEKFPDGSWILKGFGIMTLFDATTESAVSNLKTNLISKPSADIHIENIFEDVFRSIFGMADLRIGYTSINSIENKFVVSPFENKIPSHILFEQMECGCTELECDMSFHTLINEHKYLSISDVKKFGLIEGNASFSKLLLKQDIRSAIFAPILKDGKLLGIVEVVSSKTKQLNSINANKLDIVMPYLTDTIDRYYSDIQNEIDALIQKEYTTIHPSVYWKFREEAVGHLHETRESAMQEIVFNDVYPLYGQIDIKGSSNARNTAIETDLVEQINLLKVLFRDISSSIKLPLISHNIFELEKLENELLHAFKADTESVIQSYILDEIHPLLRHFEESDVKSGKKIRAYFESLDTKMQMVYHARKDFDVALTIINKKMASLLDKKQEAAQQFFPHYYERFKTDGVEHNLYIGASIAPTLAFNPLYINNLRLWQFETMCELENEYSQLRATLPYDLDVASLILVFSTPISIRFRMDEKHFDVDGTYNARYEVVKKRIDKSYIKGTEERITEKGKITIVYSQQQEEAEYRKYIQLLQHNKKIGRNVESFEVEDLQGISGLKALRVSVLYDEDAPETDSFTFQQLIEEFKE